jgi:hypothetical protein
MHASVYNLEAEGLAKTPASSAYGEHLSFAALGKTGWRISKFNANLIDFHGLFV